jgi:hypothetical protein
MGPHAGLIHVGVLGSGGGRPFLQYRKKVSSISKKAAGPSQLPFGRSAEARGRWVRPAARRVVRLEGAGPMGDRARGRTGSVPKLLDATRKDAQMDPKNTGDEAVMLETQGALALAETTTEDEAVTREQRRSRRKRDVRARTISVKRMTKRELELGRLLYPDAEVSRPKTRAECLGSEGPCPFVSCKHHLYLDVSPRTGAIKLNFPDLEVWEMNETCALDVADRGGTTLEEVGAIMNLTRERIRQVEVKGLAKLQSLRDMDALRDYVDEGPVGKRRLPILKADAEDESESDEMDDEEAEEAAEEARAASARQSAPIPEPEFDVEEFASAALDAE